MKKAFFTICLSLFILNGIIAGEVNVTHTVEKNSEKNEYKITSVFVVDGKAEFAKVSFKIPEGVKVITPSSGASVAKKETDGISFYALSVSDAGVTTVFYVQPSDEQEISIGVKFVYAVGEEKIKPSIEDVLISPNKEDFASYQGDTPEDNTFVIKDLSETDTEGETNKSTNDVDNVSNNAPSSSVSATSVENGNFSIQLLSLSDYSDERVMKFCIQHKLQSGDLIKRKVGKLTKVSIGRYASKYAANEAKKKMIAGDALLDDAFVVALK